MKERPVSFNKVLVALGLAMLLAVAFDLAVRDVQRYPHFLTWDLPDTDSRRGRQAIVLHGCGSCHVIKGIRGARGRVGPRLIGLHEQSFIAGVLPNTPENLMRWIHDPRSVNPMTAMPTLGVTAEEAADIAAYLYQDSR